jgi:hypothetical protein
MDKFTRDNILQEFDMMTQYLNKELFPIDIALLKNAANDDSPGNLCYLNICMQLMEVLIQEVKSKNKNRHNVELEFSDDETNFLRSIYPALKE